MALNLGNDFILVKLILRIEKTFGRRAKNNFCVTMAMKENLERWDIQLVIFTKFYGK